MQSLTRVGLATGTLTSEEIKYIEEAIVKTVRPILVGRQLMPIRTLGHAGYQKYYYYTETDMSQALIDMYGEEESQDEVKLTEEDVSIPIIHKEYTLHWRDVEARRQRGEDLNTQHAENAARQVAEEEDKLIITGEYSGWPAMGLAGLVGSCPAANRTDGNAWTTPANILTDLATGKNGLRALGFYGPYKLIVTPSVYAYMEKIAAGGAGSDKWFFQAVGELIGGVENILISGSLYATADAGVDEALLVDVTKGNFELIVGADLSHWLQQTKNMNYFGKVWEAVVPVIKRPNAIWEFYDVSA